MTEYPYGIPPAWWGKGRDAAGQAARDAVVLSVRVGETLRTEAGKGDVLDLRNQVQRMFTCDGGRDEAIRLLDLTAWLRRNRAQATDEAPMFADDV